MNTDHTFSSDVSAEAIAEFLCDFFPPNLAHQVSEKMHKGLFVPRLEIYIRHASSTSNSINVYLAKEISESEMKFNNPVRPREQCVYVDPNRGLLETSFIRWENNKNETHRLDGLAINMPRGKRNTPSSRSVYSVDGEWFKADEYWSHPSVVQYHRLSRSSNQGEGVDL